MVDNRINKKTLITCFALTVLLGAILRLINIASYPFNANDAAVGTYSYFMVESGIPFRYTPITHGPFTYYAIALSFHFLGDGILQERMPLVLFSIGCILLLYPLRKYLGDAGFLASALLLAVSPLFVGVSHQILLEPMLLFFIIGMIIFGLKYVGDRKVIHLILVGAFLALSFSIKEAMYMYLFIFLSFLPLYYLYVALVSDDRLESPLKKFIHDISDDIKSNSRNIFLAFAAFIIVLTLFYTSFFTYPRGIIVFLFETIPFWVGGMYSGTFVPTSYKGAHYFLLGLYKYELPILILAPIGAIYNLAVRKSRFITFLSYWALASFTIHTVLPYKTPQLILMALLPMILIAGWLIALTLPALLRDRNSKQMLIAVILIIMACFYYAHTLNDILNPQNPYVPYLELDEHLRELAENRENMTVMAIVHTEDRDFIDANSFLPWYLREYRILVFFPEEMATGAEIISQKYGQDVLSNLSSAQALSKEINIELIEKYDKPVFIMPSYDIIYFDYQLQELGYEKRFFEITGVPGKELVVYSKKI